MRAATGASERWRIFGLMAFLATLLAFASISTDLYLPALPVMAEALGASQSTMELTVSTYLIGFSIGQLFWGPIGDRYGRRRPVAVGLLIFVVGAAGCALSTSAVQLIGWRLVQALGASACVVLARTMVRDQYDRDRAARMLSLLMAIMAIAPMLGPSIGGLILYVAPWHAIFWVLVGIGVLTLLALSGQPETLTPEKRETAPMSRAFGDYARLLGNRTLLGYAGACGFLYAGIFATVAGTPFAYISYHHLSPQLYGIVFATGTIGLIGASAINSRIVTKLGSDRIMRSGAFGAACLGLLTALVSATDWGALWGLVAALFAFKSMNGFVTANAAAGAMASVPSGAGSVSAIVGSAQYGGGMIGAGLVGAFADGTPWPMGWVVALSGVGCMISVLLIQARHDGFATRG